MKASGYNPKAEFFLALGTFNKVVADQSCWPSRTPSSKIDWLVHHRYAWKTVSRTAALSSGAFTPGKLNRPKR